MDTPVSNTISNTYINEQSQQHQKLANQIKQATVAIEFAHKHLQENLPLDESTSVIRQVVQSSALLPVLLSQQLRMIEVLEEKFGVRVASTCGEEIEEIADVAKRIQATMENVGTNRTTADVAEQNNFARSIFESTSRLNILQQRIAGKMMKVK